MKQEFKESISRTPYQMIDGGRELLGKILLSLDTTPSVFKLIQEREKLRFSVSFDDNALLQHLRDMGMALFGRDVTLVRTQDFKTYGIKEKTALIKEKTVVVADDNIVVVRVEGERQGVSKQVCALYHNVILWKKTDSELRGALNEVLKRNKATQVVKQFLRTDTQDCFIGLPLVVQTTIDEEMYGPNLYKADDVALMSFYRENYTKLATMHLALSGVVVAPLDKLDHPYVLSADIARKWNEKLGAEFQEYASDFKKKILKESPNTSDEVIDKLLLLDYELLSDSNTLHLIKELESRGFCLDVNPDYRKKLQHLDDELAQIFIREQNTVVQNEVVGRA